jgi:quinoprotein relay system zinc metallohydrolase 2
MLHRNMPAFEATPLALMPPRLRWREGIGAAVRILPVILLAAFCRPASAEAAPLPVTEVAPGIYVHEGRQEDASRANRGDIANCGFVIGGKGVAVIDSGGSPAVGQALLEALRARTALPVLYVINTHMHPDHILGNVAFAGDGVQFVGHAHLPAALATHGVYYRKAASAIIDAPPDSIQIIGPTVTVADDMVLDLGDRKLRLHAWPTAHTDNDLTVYDERTATLWAGDLLFRRRIPALDGSLKGWLKVCDDIAGLTARQVVPGHGPVSRSWPQAIDDERRYLRILAADIRAALAARQPIETAVQKAAGSERGRWLLFDAYNRRNATAAYTELEWE